MARVVVKIGGTCLRGPESVRRVIEAIRSYDAPPVVVVSAFHGVTDRLIETIRRDRQTHEVIARLVELEASVLRATVESPGERAVIHDRLAWVMEELRDTLSRLDEARDPASDLEERILCSGERLSALLVASVLRAHGIPCCLRLPAELGLTTTGSRRNATIDIASILTTAADQLLDPVTHVVPGFYGVSSNNRAMLLGRGGSDYTAAALARVVRASSLDIWKGVAGLRTADPRLVRETLPVASMAYSEAAALAASDQGIIHPRCVEVLSRSGIPTHFFDIRRPPNPDDPVTVVSQPNSRDRGVVRCVAHCDAPSGRTSRVSLIGEAVGKSSAVATRAIRAGSRRNIRWLDSTGPHPAHARHLIVDRADRSTAVRTLHEEFFVHPDRLTTTTCGLDPKVA